MVKMGFKEEKGVGIPLEWFPERLCAFSSKVSVVMDLKSRDHEIS